MKGEIQISGRRIGKQNPVYVIAELSANHQNSFETAAELVRAAKSAGADAIKVQTYTADTITLSCDNEHFRIGKGTLWEGRNLHELYAEGYMPWDWQPKLKTLAEELGIHFFSSPFDDSAVNFLKSINVGAYKIASFEVVDLPLIRRVAAIGKPLIISTGMATFAEIEEAVATARAAGATELALLKCTSAYPALPEEMNLRTIPHLSQAFDLPVGLSDHTLGLTVPIAAVAIGANIIEKHLTLTRNTPGPDSAFSLEPNEFKQMVDAIRETERSIGEVHYGVSDREAASRAFRRSLFAVAAIKAGDIFTEKNIRSIRPANGLHPRHFEEILGARAACDIERGTPLRWELIVK